MSEKQLETVMNLIIHSGNAKSDCMEAIQAAKKGDFHLADEKLSDADKEILEAHHTQTNMLTSEAQGQKIEISLLTVHSQDHLMTSISFLDLTKELIGVFKKIDELQGK